MGLYSTLFLCLSWRGEGSRQYGNTHHERVTKLAQQMILQKLVSDCRANLFGTRYLYFHKEYGDFSWPGTATRSRGRLLDHLILRWCYFISASQPTDINRRLMNHDARCVRQNKNWEVCVFVSVFFFLTVLDKGISLKYVLVCFYSFFIDVATAAAFCSWRRLKM